MEIIGIEDSRLTANCDKLANAVVKVFGLSDVKRTAGKIGPGKCVEFSVYGRAPAGNAFKYGENTFHASEIAFFEITVTITNKTTFWVKNSVNLHLGMEIDGRLRNEIAAIMKGA